MFSILRYKLIITLVLLIGLVACRTQGEQNHRVQYEGASKNPPVTKIAAEPYKPKQNHWNLYVKDTLTIKGHFTDCGEWGGHHKTLHFYSLDSNDNHGYTYLRDSVTCADLPEFNRYIVERREGSLSQEKRNDVESYLAKALKKSLRPGMISHAENFYLILRKDFMYEETGDPKLLINYSAGNRELCNDFEELLAKLFEEE